MERSIKTFSCSGDSQKYFLEVTLADLYILESALNYQKDYYVSVMKTLGNKKYHKRLKVAMSQHLRYMFSLYTDICGFEEYIGKNHSVKK